MTLSDQELENFFDVNTNLSKTEREDAKIILEMTRHSKESDILSALQEMTQGFSYQRKLQVLASVGNNLLGGYDKSRTQVTTTSAKGSHNN